MFFVFADFELWIWIFRFLDVGVFRFWDVVFVLILRCWDLWIALFDFPIIGFVGVRVLFGEMFVFWDFGFVDLGFGMLVFLGFVDCWI